MRRNVMVAALVALAMTVSLVPGVGAEYRVRTDQRHEVSAGHESYGVTAAVRVAQDSDAPEEGLVVDHRLDATGLPELPSTAGIQPPEPPASDDEGLTLPNLVPLPAYNVYVGRAEHPQGPVWSNVGTLGTQDPPVPSALRFTTTIENRGRSSFELVGGPWLPDPAHEDLLTTLAYQCVRFGGPTIFGTQRACQEYRRVGTLTWHAQHRHFHIDGFGRYELRRDVNGRPDLGPGGLVAASDKVGWCVSDMLNFRRDAAFDAPYDEDEHGEHFSDGQRRWYAECTSPVLYTGSSWRQGISPGWSDTYPAGYSGQEIPLRNVADGIYWIAITINPADNPYGLTVRETNMADNRSLARVELYAGGTKARLLGPKPPEHYAAYSFRPDDQPGD